MMVPIPMLFAIETFPLLVYIFMALVVLAVPAFFVWEKVIQPQIDEKRKAQEEGEAAAEAEAAGEVPVLAAEGDALEGAEPVGLEGIGLPDGAELAEGAEIAEGAVVAEGAEFAEGAEPAVGGEEFPQADVAAPMEAGAGGEVAFEEALPEDMFAEEEGEKPAG